MDFAKIKISGGPLVLASDADVENAASSLGITFPEGYREYVTTLGEGTLEEDIRVYPPWRILADLEEWRDSIRQYWFWDEGAEVMTDEQAEESIIIADTLGGDEFIFHPSRPDRIVVLPHDYQTIFEAGANLFEVIRWLSTSGQIVAPYKIHSFEPFDSRLIEKRKWTKPKQQATTHQTVMPIPVNTPDEVLKQFFLALEIWEEEAYRFPSAKNEEEYAEALRSIKDRLYELAAPFISDNFDLGEPSSFGLPATYGTNGPRIVEVKISDDIAEIETIGSNGFMFSTRKCFFRLVGYGASWKVDGLWEITKTGRRKRIKLFL